MNNREQLSRPAGPHKPSFDAPNELGQQRFLILTDPGGTGEKARTEGTVVTV
jgi:hypothetical protein